MRNNLRKFREKSNYSQDFVAEYLGIDRSTLSKMEKGEIKYINPVYLFKLSKLYNVSIEELMGYTLPPKEIKLVFRNEKNLDAETRNKLKKIEKVVKNILFLKEVLSNGQDRD